jgi:hypothetical protein
MAAEDVWTRPSELHVHWRSAQASAGRRHDVNYLADWVRLRGHELDVYPLIEPPQVRACPLCGERFR